ncbi:aminomethyltransferase beta-barrel domain-containing protein, partial [Escherichia coli]
SFTEKFGGRGKTPDRRAVCPCTCRALIEGSVDVIAEGPVADVRTVQSACFYNGEVCLGGGIIEQRLPLPV